MAASKGVCYPNGTITVVVPSGYKIVVQSAGLCTLSKVVGFPDIPNRTSLVTEFTASSYTSAATTADTSFIINAGVERVLYEIGVGPVIKESIALRTQATPVALDATGTVTAAMILGGIVTSSTASTVTATLVAGATLDLATYWNTNDSIEFAVINTGSLPFNVATDTGHLLVGGAAVTANTSGRFRTRRTAASTFTSYRLA